MAESRRIAVVGAGAFGGWAALWLRRAGARVTLLDAWGPGNSRASSGGETRAIRAIYGGGRLYTTWVARALELWREADASWGTRLYRRVGALWLCGDDDSYVRAALPQLAELGLAVETLDPAEARARYPQILVRGNRELFTSRRRPARSSPDRLARQWRAGSQRKAATAGRSRRGRARSTAAPYSPSSSPMARGSRRTRSCSPAARGCPSSSRRSSGTRCGSRGRRCTTLARPPERPSPRRSSPIWIDMELGYYGLPASEHRGFKVADDQRGPPFDPTSGDRHPTSEGIEAARAFVARRFPGLRDAPLLEARVCQYTNTADSHLVVDTHPEAGNLWLVGGGSGHGFKLGPVLGELVAQHILEGSRPDPQLAIERLAGLGAPSESVFEPLS